jgi:hypothetical protein
VAERRVVNQIRWFRRRVQLPARRWFRDKDGSYYRNCPLVTGERNEVVAWPASAPGKYEVLDALHAEWSLLFRQGVQRKSSLGLGDVVVEEATFREAYPRNPGLWILDEEQR